MSGKVAENGKAICGNIKKKSLLIIYELLTSHCWIVLCQELMSK